MGHTTRRTTALLLAGTMTVSCATTEQRNQVLGALGGAVAGAGIAALAGGDATAIVASAAGGALVGWGAVKLALFDSKRTDDAQDEATVVGYQPAQGPVVKLRSTAASPQEVTPGQPVTFEMDYALLAPAGSTVPVRETWELTKDGKTIATVPSQQQQREPGGWNSRGSINVPKDAAKGTYIVKNRVEAGTSYDEQIAAFMVI
jgi:hypothetical protein